jgi:TPR repeat protein
VLNSPSLRIVGLLLCLTAAAISLAQNDRTVGRGAQPGVPQNGTDLDVKAQSGDPEAQFLLGYRYDQEHNYREASQWYRKAAAQGYALAQSALGSMYQMGRGVPQNFAEALKWYGLALKQDDPVAESNLGLMYARGQGTKADLGQAMKLFEKAAEEGWAPGQANLANLYAMGSSKDLVRAYMWCTLALAGGQGGCKKTIQDIFGQMSGTDIDEANNQAFQWFQTRAADSKVKRQSMPRLADDDLPVRVGMLYVQGDVVRQDDAQAVKWYRWAAERGNASAQSRLGEMYYLGRGIRKNYSQAFTWFQESAQQGDVSGERDLGFVYLQGFGVAKDEQKGVEWVRKAADRGDVGAQALLAYCYQMGTGVPRNEQEAIRLYQKAVETGNAAALNNSAWIYATSQDRTLHDPAKAFEYAIGAVQAAKEPNPNVLDTLAEAYYAQDDYDHAIQTEEKALALKPDEPSFKERLAKYQQAKAEHQQQ